jgi:hypothetical protein
MMKDSAVLKRSMFSDKMPKSVRNSGIMAGFEDDDMLEAPLEEDTMPQMARTPQNPEILMNTLRGDMRSVDARYQELAQMVGDEVAQETPPEVLAMLQMQFGQQQGGIGALPQGAGMMPPPMGGGEPMGAPGGAPAMPSPQGAMPPQGMPAMPSQGAMPLGMEGAGPFPQGGAEQAPQKFNKGGLGRRRGDDLRPLEGGGGSGGGGFSSAGRGFSSAGRPFEVTPIGQQALSKSSSGASFRDYLAQKAAETRQYFGNINQYFGAKTMAPQPTVTRMTGGTPPMNLSTQGRDTLVKDPATGVISPGTGTKFAPYTTMGPLSSPTLTQGFTQGLNRLAAEYPRVAALLPPSILAAVGVVGPNLTAEQLSTPLSPEEQARYDAVMAQIDAVNAPPPRVDPNAPAPKNTFVGGGPFDGVTPVTMPAPEVKEEEEPTTNEFINQNLAKPQFKELSRIERIKAAQGEYTPLYKELIGDSSEDAKTNAMLLLADAGFKLASTYKPTFAMAVAESAKDLPRGFANIIAQDRDRDIKLKTAALTQAISDVQEQDKYAQALKIQLLKGDFDLLKTQAKEGAILIEDAGLGGRVSKTKSGNFVGFHLDPKDPAVISAISSRYTLRDTDNPFVMNRGEAPTTVETNKEERIKLGNALRNIDSNLSTIDSMKNTLERAYSPGTWFEDKVNNIFVPISFGLIKPNFDTAGAVTQLKNDFNRVTKNSAAAAESGRISNQQQEWERENAGMLANPAGFFEDPELAAKNLTSLEATNRNMRQQILTQLGFEKNDFVMTAPNTGTKNDPFVISSDPKEQQIMFNFLGSTFGRIQDPKAVVYLKLPNGKVDAFNPSQLRAQTGR